MNNQPPLHLHFQQLLEKEDYSSSSQYDQEELIHKLSQHERELLATLMIKHAEKIIPENLSQTQYYLQRARQIAPDSAKIISLASHVNASQTTNIEMLQEAAKGYAELAELRPNDYDLLFHWASVDLHLGRLQQDMAIFQEANSLLDKADSLIVDKNSRQPMLSWLRAQVWHALAKISGEASDYSLAVEYYRDASEHDIKVTFFWNDYANALLEFGILMKRLDVHNAAIELYQKAIRLDPRCYNSQFNLGVCYHRLFEKTWKNQYFWHAHEQYSHSRILDDKNPTLAYSWGRLLLNQGKLRRDSDLLRQACNHLESAALLDKHSTTIANLLCEAFTWTGGIIEDLSLLKHAETTLEDIITAEPENYDAWCNSGFCQYELGYYFNDPSLVREAIKKYTHAITLNRAHMKAWYGLATCTLALGELDNDTQLLTTTLSYFTQASEFDGPFFPQFWNDWGVAAMKLAELTNNYDYLDLAQDRFEHAIDLDLTLSDGEFVDPEWLYNYGCIFDFIGDITDDFTYYEKAIQVLLRVVEIDPNYAQAKYNLAMAYAHLGESVDDLEALQRACEMFKQLVITDQDDEMSWNEWGLCLIHMAVLVSDPASPTYSHQYLTEAEAKFQHAIALGHLPAFYNLACIYSLMGDYHTSMSFLERADANEALPSQEEIIHDEWLEGTRHTDEFRRFWQHIINKYGEPPF